MTARLRLTLLLIPALLLCHCGLPVPPQCQRVPKSSQGDPADLVAEARQAWDQLAGPADRRTRALARTRYNTAVAKLFDQINCGGDDFTAGAAAIGIRIDRSRSLGTGLHLEDLDALVRADRVEVDLVGGHRCTDPGIGVAVVGWKATSEEGKERWDFAPPTGIPLNLTAYLDFNEAGPPRMRLRYPGRTDGVRVGSRNEPLAADWSAPGALYWQMSLLDDVDLAKVFLPSRFDEETKLYLATPYKSDRIPVVFVHGLKSSPGAYRVMFNELLGEEWFRERYQAWFFNYPTGNSWLLSAARFRDEVARATEYAAERGPLDQWNRMVIIGHSMGGVITHASLVEPGNRVYDTFASEPLDQLDARPDTRRIIEKLAIYDPLPQPERAVFLAAPHRGSPLADRFFADWASRLIQLPKKITIDAIDLTLTEFVDIVEDGETTRIFETSIGTLSPSYDGYAAVNASPFRAGLKRHSIIGDRGRGDTPESSDGVVPYWSSHLEPVNSELIVPADHHLTKHPESIREVKRILQLHLEE